MVGQQNEEGNAGFLLIPDGMRRYASANSLELINVYIAAARKLLRMGETLLEYFPYVGLYPLASYNLTRNNTDLRALLDSCYEVLTWYLTSKRADIRISVIGDLQRLANFDRRYANLFPKATINVHRSGLLTAGPRTLVLYFAYDWDLYIHEVYQRWPPHEVSQHVPQWDYVLRTGCECGVFRYSGVFLGTAQARILADSRLFPEMEMEDLLIIVKSFMTKFSANSSGAI